MKNGSNLNDPHYPVMEHFATIQGEGKHSGTPAYFIRLGGCDVGCHWCDVKESWPLEGHQVFSANELTELVVKSGLKIAVITGGEPTLHNLDALTNELSEAGIAAHIESAGTNELSGTWNWVTYSPKKFKSAVSSFAKQADELKVVVYNKSDFDFAEQHAKEVSDECELFLQPEWSKQERVTNLIVEYVKTNPKWRISLQTHKYLNIP